MNARKQVLAVLTALLMVPASLLGLAALGLPVAGVDFFSQEEAAPEAAPEAQAVVADFTETPAARVFSSTFRGLEEEWGRTPFSVSAAGLPHPLDCVTPAATLSQSRAYDASGRAVQITLAAYPAGLGAEMFQRLAHGVQECKPSGTYVSTYPVDGLGVEAVEHAVSWAGNSIETVVLRRGDVLAFVATDRGAGARTLAVPVDRLLGEAMPKRVCRAQQAGVSAKFRNASFSGNSFKGKRVREVITSEPAPLPELTPELEAEGVEEVAVPARRLKHPRVERPVAEVSYPLWPLLPEEVEEPSWPAAPEPQKLEDRVAVRVEDGAGPGCGWAFLQSAEAAYDEEVVEAENRALLASAQEILDGDGPRWQAAILTYWREYAAYREAVREYRAYGEEVRAVAQAWEAIHAEWREYYSAYATWQAAEAARLAFIEEKKQARVAYRELIQECATYLEELEAYPALVEEWEVALALWEVELEAWKERRKSDPDFDPATDPRPKKPKKPEAPEKPEGGCPAVRPAILDQAAPKPTPEPTPPADPRPEGERD